MPINSSAQRTALDHRTNKVPEHLVFPPDCFSNPRFRAGNFPCLSVMLHIPLDSRSDVAHGNFSEGLHEGNMEEKEHFVNKFSSPFDSILTISIPLETTQQSCGGKQS